MKHLFMLATLAVVLGGTSAHAQAAKSEKAKTENKVKSDKGKKVTNPSVVFETSQGKFTAELYQDKAPISVKNFLAYVESGFYKGTIFHRVIPNFMIQGGGFDEKMSQKPTKEAIKNEADNGLKNEEGTLAMARTAIVDSATAQFFINVKKNDFLDHRDKSPSGYGYAVFGKVTEGLDVVKKIEKVKTGRSGMHDDVPVEPITITNITLKK